MKTKLTLISLFLLATAPVWAAASIHFSTITATGNSWTITNLAGVYTMTFYNIEVDSPVADAIVNDFVGLPTMTLTNFIDHGPLLGMEATLTPTGPLTITSNVDLLTKMTASVGSGGVLYAGNNFQAFSVQMDDLNVTSYMAGYSTVIDQLAVIDAGVGGYLDLSFTGSDGPIYTFLKSGQTGSISGNLSGQINGLYVPAPGAILLGGIGVTLVGWLRRRRTM